MMQKLRLQQTGQQAAPPPNRLMGRRTTPGRRPVGKDESEASSRVGRDRDNKEGPGPVFPRFCASAKARASALMPRQRRMAAEVNYIDFLRESAVIASV